MQCPVTPVGDMGLSILGLSALVCNIFPTKSAAVKMSRPNCIFRDTSNKTFWLFCDTRYFKQPIFGMDLRLLNSTDLDHSTLSPQDKRNLLATCFTLTPLSAYSLTLKKEAKFLTEILVDFGRTARSYVPKVTAHFVRSRPL